ncbi:MAG: divergent polysaccharide deacetylase family protein [Proteobacteria bacterium]|nr:divergent polysaccharide deacetylase family protein [Pseudomonadota bacterium]
MIAIILDDMGLDRRRSEQATRLPGPLTLSYMSYADDLIAQTGSARARGHELMLHLPMEPEGDADPGPGALLMKLSDGELRERIDFALGRFPGFVAVNNHMGSRLTADPARMRLVLGAIRRSGHLFLDSLTTPRAVALSLGPKMGVPTIVRDVFLDDVDSQEEVWFRLLKAEHIAETEGTAIAIGHPRDATLAVLEDWIAERGNRSAKLVPVSAIARVRLGRQQLVMIKP